MRASEAKAKMEAEAQEKGIATGDAFLWKDGVDAVRDAAHHAHQFSSFLDLMSKRVLTLTPIVPINTNAGAQDALMWHEARLAWLGRACASISAARDRIVHERTLDSKFIESLRALSGYWNIRPLPKSRSQSPQAGPQGALSVSLSLNMADNPHELGLLLLRRADGNVQAKQPPKFELKRLKCLVDPLHVPGDEDVAGVCILPADDVGQEVVSPMGVNLASYLMYVLTSQLDKEVFRTMTGEVCQPATPVSKASAVHVSANYLSCGPVVVHQVLGREAAENIRAGIIAARGGDDGSRAPTTAASAAAASTDAATKQAECEPMAASDGDGAGALRVPEDKEGRILTIVSRQLQRALHRQRQKPTPPSGGQVPRKPQQKQPFALAGIVPALDSIARHTRFRAALSEVLETCARLPIIGRSLSPVVHHCRSESPEVSCLAMHLSSPLAGSDGEQQPQVVVQLCLRKNVATATVSPAVVGRGRLSDVTISASVAPIQLSILSSMAVLFMQGLQLEAERLGCRTALSWGLVPDLTAGADLSEDSTQDKVAAQVVLRFARPELAASRNRVGSLAASPPSAKAACKVLTLVAGDRETLRVQTYGEGGVAAGAVAECEWENVRGRHWWDRVRRLVLLW